ncbi:hypothetical protein HRI_003040700 [Hibiscus trionum]|uniref:C2H2-type domain-containing protein n=1 Tax=Hibiscus trionum TaxID=183268 RepID=A0A9W7ICW5_HIBTR|nr:hypothetical protein HRI_003040700 [Hibiscus trionum]
MKDYIFHPQQQQQQQQQQQVLDENMSNLTSASGEASVSSRNSAGGATNQPPQSQPVKRKRNQPGNPDPDAEVVAFSPKTLMATNRFVCDICNKGFQRDQNLQLHRRGHNLPWKLKQRTSNEVKKKVYVCPEPSCVHHDPSRALGDLTGIKKHYSRKHGEKKWKCEKCSKKYAVQSDWKAHSKTCGTREYRCDCGTLFSRRDSFITHRAFCDALAEENSRTITGTSHLQVPQDIQQRFSNVPPWLATQPMLGTGVSGPSSSMFFPSFDENSLNHYHQISTVVSPHMSATALLQKAAQMGATVSSKTGSSSAPASSMGVPHQQTHVSAGFGGSNNNDNTSGVFGLNLCSSREDEHAVSSGAHPSLLLQDMMNSLSSAAATGFDATSFDDIAFSGILSSKNKNGSGGQGLTRDFLGS